MAPNKLCLSKFKTRRLQNIFTIILDELNDETFICVFLCCDVTEDRRRYCYVERFAEGRRHLRLKIF